METNLAVLVDFENIAAGTEKEGLGRFDVEALMGRIKDKGRILIARSYADWGRFARFKQALLMSNVTMMELTSHGMQDKNRADIAMVVDTLELAFTKDYIDTFVVVSGDSDFTPLVLKLRELNKRVIGCGTRASTSRLLIQACDEFFFYDTLVQRQSQQRSRRRPPTAGKQVLHKDDAFSVLINAIEGLQRENPDPPLASVVKGAILRKNPDFSEADLGFSSFARFLEAAQKAGYAKVIRDQKSGGYRVDSVESPNTEPTSAPAASDRWMDDRLPRGSEKWVLLLAEEGLNPLAASTRLDLLQAIEEAVAERRRRRRRISIQYVQEDVRKRLRRIHPNLPPRNIRAIFKGLMLAGVLLHRDGSPVRSTAAPFVLEKTAEELNLALTNLYLSFLNDNSADLTATTLLTELFLGNVERVREIEEIVAWISAHDDDDDEEERQEEEDDDDDDVDDLNIDDLLTFDDQTDDVLLEVDAEEDEADAVEETDDDRSAQNDADIDDLSDDALFSIDATEEVEVEEAAETGEPPKSAE
ncbi:MAG: NYN domain-containing protein [Proteobacteria bacterium]|nr:NYN domain-containing protein [Pseudomonadota bacterium]